ncbi:DUF7857 domain-containing protein [Halorussus ruber]|uniref:DUF7857 domain-containing protein n=1 Tax=Halorussus ruber TaxID=1126238 RepID=UPI001092A4D0|nr:hypothetical protein [Halorussus ruber]
MVELDSRVETRDGVALVELVVRNPTDTARRFRVGNLLDGPLWPPRSRGVPEAGWDDGGFEGVVPAEERRALGYASPLSGGARSDSLPEPPAEIVWTERAGETEAGNDASFAAEATPEGVVRSLGDHRPPADAVPTPRSGDTVSTPESGRSEPDPRRSP